MFIHVPGLRRIIAVGAVACSAVALGGIACTDPAGPPTASDPLAESDWIEPGTDTYAQLHLRHAGFVVSGWYALRGALPTTDEPITLVAGQYVKPALRLQWEFYGWAMTLDGRLEGDTMIVGTLSSKEGSTPVRFYRRTAAATRARVAERGLDLPVR